MLVKRQLLRLQPVRILNLASQEEFVHFPEIDINTAQRNIIIVNIKHK